jgi:hypothetical protein
MGDMKERYASFARSFKLWHYRMTPSGYERASACWLLSVIQAANLFSLSLWLPAGVMPAWAVAPGVITSGVLFYFINRPFFATAMTGPSYANWSNNVPTYSEFSGVYNYLMATVLLFLLPWAAGVAA